MKKIFINNLLITLIFFLFFEIFLRSFGLSDLRGHGKELIEKQKNTETVVFGKKVYLDKYGYRVPSIKYEYNNKLEKIIFIGDSVLFGSGMNEENTFIGKFRKSKKKYSFVNAAIVGNDIEQIYLDVKTTYDNININININITILKLISILLLILILILMLILILILMLV